MNQKLSAFIAMVLLACLQVSLRGSEVPATLRQAFQAHCIQCHGQDEFIEGKVNLLALKSGDDLLTQPKLLEKLVSALDDRHMPPEDAEPALPDAKRDEILAELKIILRQSQESAEFIHTPIHRMNRFQYNNAVVDLLELDRDIFQLNERLMRRRIDYFHPETGKMPDEVRVSCRPLSKDIDNERPEGFRGVAPFPQDQRAEHGFDNRADHLSLSPLLMEAFLQLSQSVSESPDINPKECKSWNWLFAPIKDANNPEEIQARLEKLLRRAFRKPVDPETLKRFTTFANDQLTTGASVEETMRTVIGAVLGMPEFLYLSESFEPTAASEDSEQNLQPVNDFELATRLSQFFWSSIPDDELLDLAASGELSHPETLSEQIDRMLNDKRTSRFCDNFPSQWLQLDRLVTAIPDREKYPFFYYFNGYRTSMHMMSEPLLLFETVFVENRSVIELLNPKFTWQSDMLKSNYNGESKGSTDVKVQTFRRVPLDDPRRGGVITNLAVLTMTSTPTRTQPITRGAWINTVIFNDPPEPPPADVPPLPEVDKEALAKLTIRERLAAHRQRADCAGCHNKIDPLGFALENYGPTGVWRDKYENGREVDVSGVLFNRYEFDNVVEFKELILKEKHRFIRGFVSHLLSYALGRELGPADSPALDEMTEQAMAGKDEMREVLKSVAMSKPFLHKSLPIPVAAKKSND